MLKRRIDMKKVRLSAKLAIASICLVSIASVLHSQVPDCSCDLQETKCPGGEFISCPGGPCDGSQGDCEGYSQDFWSTTYYETSNGSQLCGEEPEDVLCSRYTSCYTDYLPYIPCIEGSCQGDDPDSSCNSCATDNPQYSFSQNYSTEPCPET
jgi:hypothetical protein